MMTPGTIYAQKIQDNFEFIRPAEGHMVFAKKPEMECRILVPFDRETLYIEFDYTDMTALAKITDTGFILRPVQVIMPGEHTLLVSFTDSSKKEIIKELRFQTRHTKTFEQAYSQNTITNVYTNILKKMDDARDRTMSDWVLESNLENMNIISEGPWEFGFNTTLQYFDQELAAEKPQTKGVELIRYEFTGKYEKGTRLFNMALGDVNIDETRNTVSGLSRRGGTIGADLGNVYFAGFVVRSDMIYGELDGEYGLDFDNSDHIYGASAGLRLFKNMLDIKTIYADGGESASDESYGIWPEPSGTQGKVYGIEVKSNFFEDKFNTRAEMDWSDYDNDTADTTVPKSGNAWIAGIDGMISLFNYEASYEYTCPDYKVPGNGGTQEDWEGLSVMTGLNFEVQSINANYGQHNNNVKNNPTYTRINSIDYGLGYNLDAITWLPITLSWRRAVQESDNEPAGTDETKTYTDDYSGTITYTKESWNLSLQPVYSEKDDRTSVDYDTSSKELTVACMYYSDKFSLSPSITGNRQTDYSTQIKTDTYTYNLGFDFTNIIDGLNIEGNASYTKQYNSDATMDQDNYNGDIQIRYQWTSPIKGILSPSIMLRAEHLNNNDEIEDTDNKETIIYLILSADLDLSF